MSKILKYDEKAVYLLSSLQFTLKTMKTSEGCQSLSWKNELFAVKQMTQVLDCFVIYVYTRHCQGH